MSQAVKIVVKIIKVDAYGYPIRVEFILIIDDVVVGRFPSKLAAESKASDELRKLRESHKSANTRDKHASTDDDEYEIPAKELARSGAEIFLFALLGIFILLFLDDTPRETEIFEDLDEAKARFDELTKPTEDPPATPAP